jgi:hypothetical protein
MTLDREPIDAPLRPGRWDLPAYGLLSLLISLATSIKALPNVLAGGLINPDSYMRLVRLDDELHRHAIEYVVARDGSGGGTLLHWSHLLDLLLIVLAAPFRLATDTHAALHAAAVMFGPLSMAGLGAALCWAIAPLAGRRWLWLAPASIALSPAIASYGLPGVAHHHVPMLAVIAMVAGYALRGALGLVRKGDGFAMGAWAGIGIWLTPESMPFTLMAFAGLWLAWLQQPGSGHSRMIAETAAAFALVILAAFVVDPPYAGYGFIEIDRISLVYVGLAIAVATMGCASIVLDRVARGRLIAGLIVPAACIIVWLASFPAVIRGPDGLMSARDTKAMFDGIVEMAPVHSVAEAIEYLLTGSVAAVVLAWYGFARRSLLLGYAALCACMLVALGAQHVRFAAVPAALAAVILPILIARFSSAVASWPDALQALVRTGIIAAFVLLPCGAAFTPAKAAAGEPVLACALGHIDALLRDHADQVVMANVNDTPELLYRTRSLTVGSLYHRNVAAFLRLRAAWRTGPSGTVPTAVRATHATLVLFCPSPLRSLLVADLPPDTLMDQLNHGRVPPWLRRLREDPHSGNVLYEVIP